jgi:WhiB family redox-sensing transcriptional regulator
VTEPPEWMSQAACRGLDSNIFYPDPPKRGIGIAAARACLPCPVQDECLLWALQKPEKFGVWGGTSERDREAILKGIYRKRCPVCGSGRHTDTTTGQICMACGVYWQTRQRAPREKADAPAR